MTDRKEIMTAVGTLAIAIGVGSIMQSSEAAKDRYGTPSVRASSVVPTGAAVPVFAGVLPVEEIKHTAASSDDMYLEEPAYQIPVIAQDLPVIAREEPLEIAALSGMEFPAPMEADVAPNIGCDITAEATPLPGALVEVVLNAPCLIEERVTLHHEGMMFADLTDKNGQLNAVIPALAETAKIVFAFSDGDGAVAETDVPDLDGLDRVVLQWRGDMSFGLHAFEYGAQFDTDGHVWSGASAPQSASGGQLMKLGNPDVADPLLAEAYTFPTKSAPKPGSVNLSVQTEITSENCGREIVAETFQKGPNSSLIARDLTVAMPGCDIVGDFLLLNNLVSDLKIASN